MAKPEGSSVGRADMSCCVQIFDPKTTPEERMNQQVVNDLKSDSISNESMKL